MAFPATWIGARVEVMADNAWVDLIDTSDVRYDQDISIKRGRDNEQSSLSYSYADMKVDNRDGRYNPRNPSSDLAGKIGQNTPSRVVVPISEDTFTRTASNGWGSTDTGYAYTRNGGAAGDFSVGSGVGAISITAVNSVREMYLADLTRKAVTVTFTVRPTVVATGGSITMSIVVRRADGSNYYFGGVRFVANEVFWDDGVFTVTIAKNVAGVETTVAAAEESFTYDASSAIVGELTIFGSYIRMRAWDLADTTRMVSTSTNDESITAAGAVGVRMKLLTGNTNTLPFSPTVDNMLIDDVRHSGEIPAWPARQDLTGRDKYVPLQSAGILRRLSQGSKALRSPYARFVTIAEWGTETDRPWAYWPLEDSSGSTQGASLYINHRIFDAVTTLPARAVGSFQFAIETGPTGSASLPSIATTAPSTRYVRGTVPAPPTDVSALLYDLDTDWGCFFWVKLEGTSASIGLMDLTAAGSLLKWRVTAENSGTATVNLEVRDISNTLIDTATINTDIFDGEWHMICARAEKVGSDVVGTLRVDGSSLEDSTSTMTTQTVGRPMTWTSPAPVTQTNVTSAAIGHVFFASGQAANAADMADMIEVMSEAYAGELAGDRMIRLSTEEDIPFAIVGSAADTQAMGPQGIATYVDLMSECFNVDLGIPFEPRQFVGLAYRTRIDLYNQTPNLELDYSSQHLSGNLEPTGDDQLLRNDVTVSRTGGSSANTFQATGPLSVLTPPSGVGPYQFPVTLNVETDDQLPPLAGWLLHLGTVDEDRWPMLSVALERPVFTASASLTADVAGGAAVDGVDIGDVISVASLPDYPDDVSAQVQGYREVIGRHTRTFDWNTAPASPYTVAVVDDDTTGKVGSDGSELSADITSGATSIKVATTGTQVDGYPSYRWTTDATEYPFDLRINRPPERVTASACANGTWTFVGAGTAATSANAAGSSTVAPSLHASTTTGDVVFCLASIRNSGTGVPDTPSEYTRLPVFPTTSNVQLFGKIAEAGEGAPTISFTGGVANATLVAQCATFRASTGVNDLDNMVMHATALLNVSAQNIAYPKCPVPEDNCLIMYLGWKQDDWTSVATIASAAEIGEPDDTLGDDAGIVWDYVIQTSKADIAAGSFTVTGGASAISRGAVVAVRVDVQTFTVTRSVNGVTKAHSAGADVSLWTPAVVGL